jgi:RNA polymerase sigma factor (sigma-70 family)
VPLEAVLVEEGAEAALGFVVVLSPDEKLAGDVMEAIPDPPAAQGDVVGEWEVEVVFIVDWHRGASAFRAPRLDRSEPRATRRGGSSMAAMSQDDAGELVRAAAAGDEAAWRALVDRFAALVWAVTRSFSLERSDAADVSQVTWLRLVEHLDRLTEPDRVGAWLATTAKRECLGVLRRRGRSAIPASDDDVFERLPAAQPAPSHRLVAGERNLVLWSAVETLSERCQRLLRVLMADPPPAYDAVSAALDMPIGSIGPTRARCLAHLRRYLADGGITGDALSSVE